MERGEELEVRVKESRKLVTSVAYCRRFLEHSISTCPAVLRNEVTLLIGIEVGYRGTLVRKFVSSFWCETEVSAVGYCKIIS